MVKVANLCVGKNCGFFVKHARGFSAKFSKSVKPALSARERLVNIMLPRKRFEEAIMKFNFLEYHLFY
jgi:hypothetical protein